MEKPKSVAGILFNSSKTHILLIKRRDVPVWVLPGGGIEPKESPEFAIEREILEETGFTVKLSRLIGDYLPLNRISKRTHLYECTSIKGSPTLSSETRDIGFFDLKNLPPLPPPYPDWIEDALQNLPPVMKNISSVTYTSLIKHFFSHPILVTRFLLSRIGLTINTK